MKQEDIWKEESEQLKKDLASREKEYKKREVPIRFAAKNKKKQAPISPEGPSQSSSAEDNYLRNNLGIT
jgi:hypothetical protein